MTRASFYDAIKITHENTTEMKTRGKRDSDVLKLNDIITLLTINNALKTTSRYLIQFMPQPSIFKKSRFTR